MLVYPSIEELISEVEAGSVVVMPDEFFGLAANLLAFSRLVQQDKGRPRLGRAPFYVLNVEPFVPVLIKSVTEEGFEAKVEAPIPNTGGRARAFGGFSWKRKREEVWKQDETTPDGPRIYDVERQVASVLEELESSGNSASVKVLIFYPKTYSAESVKALRRAAKLVSNRLGIIALVGLPVTLDKTAFLTQVDDLKSVIERLKIEPALLLGIDPLEVREVDEKGRIVVSLPVPRYLIMKILETTLPVEDVEQRRELAKEYTNTVISYMFDPAFERRKRHSTKYPFATMSLLPSPDWERNHSVNTVFLDALYSEAKKLRALFRVKFPHSDLNDFAVFVARWAAYQFGAKKKFLAEVVKRLGATEDTVETIKNAGIYLHRIGWTDVRMHEYSKWWESNVEQKTLETA